MQEFKPIGESQPAHPSEEDLAAFIDGTLGKAEARRITAHLASCEECYDIYAGAVRFQIDSGPATPENVVPLRRASEARPRWVSWRIPSSIAALLLVGVGSGYVFFFLAAPPALRTAQVTALVPRRAAESLWLGPTYRGGGEGEEAPLDTASFQMGVQLVNLQVSLKAGNAEQAQGDVVPRMLNLVEPQLFAGELYEGYRGISAALGDPGKPARNLLPEAARLAEEAREVFLDTESLDFGQWVEAGRLAALARDPSFFQQGESRRFLRRLLWRDKLGLGETKLDAATRESLQEISRIVSRGELQPADYGNLVGRFEAILEVHYPKV